MLDPTVQTADTVSVDSAAQPATTAEAPSETALVEADLLVEDVSIDGMCGVY